MVEGSEVGALLDRLTAEDKAASGEAARETSKATKSMLTNLIRGLGG